MSSERASAENKNLKSTIFPTLVNNSTVILDLKEAYRFVRIFDVAGNEVMNKALNGNTGRTIINLPKLSAGIYLVQLSGKYILQQKIYITK